VVYGPVDRRPECPAELRPGWGSKKGFVPLVEDSIEAGAFFVKNYFLRKS
jgi:hypothetical protein